jgi:hypothetical protein
MKGIFAILLLLTIMSCSNNKATLTYYPVVHASFICAKDSTDKNNLRNQQLIKIRISIVNITKYRVSFWMMSCSKEDNFIINTDYFRFYSYGCDSNYPDLIKINPNDSLIWNTNIIKSSPFIHPFVKDTRFGLIYIDSLKCQDMHQYLYMTRDKFYQDKIIWSNALNLDN